MCHISVVVLGSGAYAWLQPYTVAKTRVMTFGCWIARVAVGLPGCSKALCGSCGSNSEPEHFGGLQHLAGGGAGGSKTWQGRGAFGQGDGGRFSGAQSTHFCLSANQHCGDLSAV